MFSQVLASTLFKKRALHNFSLQISTAVFRRFWFEEVQKNTFFSMCFISKFCNARCIFLQTGAYTLPHESPQTIYTLSFCTPKHLNTSAKPRLGTRNNAEGVPPTDGTLNKRTLLKDIGHQPLKHKCVLSRRNAQSVSPMDGNVPHTGPQQEDLVKTRTYFTSGILVAT